MKAWLHRFAWRLWQGEAGAGGTLATLLLTPVAWIWTVAVRAKNRRWDRTGGEAVEGLDVLSVGNLAVGGTGKTPFASWAVGVLESLGRRPALLMRGYGSDEVRLHRRWRSQLTVEVDPDRLAAARRAREAGADCAVLDDGFQHRRLGRLLDVVLLAAEDPLPGAVLPRGPYREPLGGLRRAEVVVITRRTAGADQAERRIERLKRERLLRDGAAVGRVCFEVREWTTLGRWAQVGETAASEGAAEAEGAGSTEDSNEAAAVEPPVKPSRAVAVTTVARPDAFARAVGSLVDGPIDLVSFPDHHDFTPAEVDDIVARAKTAPVYVTEKDAVKLVAQAQRLADVRVVHQRMVWEQGEDDVRRRIEALFGTGAPPEPAPEASP